MIIANSGVRIINHIPAATLIAQVVLLYHVPQENDHEALAYCELDSIC